MNEYYEVNDGWFTYYVNAETGEKKITLEDGEILVPHEIDENICKCTN